MCIFFAASRQTPGSSESISVVPMISPSDFAAARLTSTFSSGPRARRSGRARHPDRSGGRCESAARMRTSWTWIAQSLHEVREDLAVARRAERGDGVRAGRRVDVFGRGDDHEQQRLLRVASERLREDERGVAAHLGPRMPEVRDDDLGVDDRSRAVRRACEVLAALARSRRSSRAGRARAGSGGRPRSTGPSARPRGTARRPAGR